jgi:hypothetical protein
MTPFQAFVGTFVGLGGTNQSTFVTFSFANTAGFDAFVPVRIGVPATTSISCGAEVTLYRTTDGGLTWETAGSPASVFPRPTAASQVQRRDILIPTGQFLVSVQVGGGSASVTWSVDFGTAWVITAYA